MDFSWWQFSFHMLWLLSHAVYWCQNSTFCLKSSSISSNPTNQFLLCSPAGDSCFSPVVFLSFCLATQLYTLPPRAQFVPVSPRAPSTTLSSPHRELLSTAPIELHLTCSLANTGSKYGWGSWALSSWWPGLNIGESGEDFGSFRCITQPTEPSAFILSGKISCLQRSTRKRGKRDLATGRAKWVCLT